MRSRDLAGALPIAGGATVWAAGVAAMLVELPDGWWPLLLVAMAVATAMLCAGAALAVATAFRRGAAGSHALVITACALGLVGATPVATGWHDGCNSHGGRIALAGVPSVKPATPVAPYVDTLTAKACLG